MEDKKYGKSIVRSISMDLEELEKVSQKSKNANCLHAIVCEHWKNEVICRYVAGNISVSVQTLEILAKHPDKIVRLLVAKRGNLITDQRLLATLTFDPYIPVRRALSKTTTNEGIKRLLFKGNQKDEEIVWNCLRRTKDMELIMSFVLGASEQNLKKFAKAILCNSSITELEIRALLTASSEISDTAMTELIDNLHNPYGSPIPLQTMQLVDDYIITGLF